MAQDRTLGPLVVVGGSRGIGAATVRLAARRGAAVAFSYAASDAAAEALVAEVERDGGRALALRADAADPGAAAALFDAAEAAHGPARAVFVNAGITGPLGPLADLPDDALRRVIDVNVVGVLLAAREAARRLSTARGGPGGAIVLMSSRAAALGGAGEWVHYAASKGAVDALTIGLARELGPEGVRVNAVAPGLIETEIHARAGAADRVRRLMDGVPLGRAGAPEEVAETALWLLSEAASYVSGAIAPISGGR
jgi:NAD(P)-dependent dehydrogenase (short-subunit alcohol dehydrogenase family)